MMKILLASFLLLGLTVVAPSAQAQFSDIKLSVTRKKLKETKSTSSSTTTRSKEIVYTIALKNSSLRPTADLQVNYMLFYEDSQQGAADSTFKSVRGGEKVPSIESNRSVTIETKPFVLSSQDLNPGWVYASGANPRNKDMVRGIWVKVFSGGEIVGEYMNPTTLSKKYAWKE